MLTNYRIMTASDNTQPSIKSSEPTKPSGSTGAAIKVVKVFLKGLTLMETMVAREEPYGITELATELGLTTSIVHLLLQTMFLCGYAIKSPLTNRSQCTRSEEHTSELPLLMRISYPLFFLN